MEKSIRSKDLKNKKKYELVVEDIDRFHALIRGHRKILEAIGGL